MNKPAIAVQTQSQDLHLASHLDDRTYGFRTAIQSDVAGVNQLFFTEYGDDYPYPIRSLSHSVVHLVAFEQATGSVVGFARATPIRGHEHAFEFGGLIVHPDHRGFNIAKRLTRLRIEHVRARDGRMTVSEPVCYRPDCASQANLIKHGFVLFGIQPGKYPDLQDKFLHGQAESVLMAVRSLEGDTGFGRRCIYLPDSHAATLHVFLPRYLYTRGFDHQVAGSMPSIIKHEPQKGSRTIGSLFVDIPLNWPSTTMAIEAFYSDGYRFACVLPGFGMTEQGEAFDYMRMYRWSAGQPDVNFNHIHVVSQLQALKEVMMCDRAR